jgi:hypothetical protein
MFEAYLEDARKNGVILIVLHNSGIKQMQRYVKATNDGKPALHSDKSNPDSVAPGGILRVAEKNKVLHDKIVLKDVKQKREGARKSERKET